jgi:hypothetical protein
LAGFVPAVAVGGTIYVDADANSANDGSNWTDAYNNLDYALYIARYGVELCHGYKPTASAATDVIEMFQRRITAEIQRQQGH